MDSKRCVENITHLFFDDRNYIIIDTSPRVIRIQYYNYMKMFTHCVDYLKSKDDPSRMDVSNVKFIPPETEDEWYTDIEILHKGDSCGISLQELAMRRCEIIK